MHSLGKALPSELHGAFPLHLFLMHLCSTMRFLATFSPCVADTLPSSFPICPLWLLPCLSSCVSECVATLFSSLLIYTMYFLEPFSCVLGTFSLKFPVPPLKLLSSFSLFVPQAFSNSLHLAITTYVSPCPTGALPSAFPVRCLWPITSFFERYAARSLCIPSFVF